MAVNDYLSMYSGQQMDDADTEVFNPDATPTEGSDNLVTSGGVFEALRSATIASAPAILNTASGAVCAFPDGSASPMTSVIAEIVAKQAGSGTPYPAGGGKNKLQTTLTSQTNRGTTITVNADGSVTISGTPTSAVTVAFSTTNSASGEARTISCSGFPAGVRVYCKRTNDGTSAVDYPTVASASTTAFAVGSAYSMTTFTLEINTSYDGTAATLKLQLENGSTATDWSPYSNIRPITGYTGANVFVSAIDLVTTIEQGSLTQPANVKRCHSNNPIYVKAGDTLYIERTRGRVRIAFGIYSAPGSGTVLYDSGWKFTNDNNDQQSFVMPNTGYITFGFAQNDLDAAISPQDVVDAGYIASFNAETTHNISWQDEAGTLYGGQVDLVSGVLTATHKAVDLGTLTWNYSASIFISPEIDTVAGTANIPDIICEAYPAINYGALGDKQITISSGKKIWVKDSSYNDADVFKTAMNGILLVYPLVTPETYNLTPQEVASLLGQNTLWNDVGGDTSAEYRADTKLYIQSLLGA